MAMADIGLIGLGVMGRNLVLNMNDRGIAVAVYNRTAAKASKWLGAFETVGAGGHRADGHDALVCGSCRDHRGRGHGDRLSRTDHRHGRRRAVPGRDRALAPLVGDAGRFRGGADHPAE